MKLMNKKTLAPARILKGLALSGMAAGMAASMAFGAHATEDPGRFDVEFSFVRSAPVQETYSDFLRTARQACRDTSQAVRIGVHIRHVRECEAELVDKAVHKTGMANLIAYHSEMTGTTPTVTPQSR